jgi:hypothetical protein
LSLDEEWSDASCLNEFDYAQLVNLSIRKSSISTRTFARFLEKHANAMERIICEDLWLDGGYDAGPGSKPDWFTILEMMTQMPRLKTVHFANLIQNINDYSKISKYCLGDDRLERLGGQATMDASGDVAGKLARTIGEKVTVDKGVLADIRYQVWFV